MLDDRTLRLLTLCLVGALSITACATAQVQQLPSGDFGFSNDLYEARFSPAGRWTSFAVKGQQMLDVDAGRPFLTAPALQIIDHHTLGGSAEARRMTVRFHKDRFDVEVFDAKQTAAQAMQWKLNDAVRWAVFPRDGGTTHHVPIAHRQDKGQGARFIATSGTAFETDHRTWLDPHGGGRIWGTFRYPRGLTMTFIPLASAKPTDLLFLDYVNHPKNQFFDDPQIALNVSVTHEGPDPLEVELVGMLKEYQPNRPSRILQQQSRHFQITSGASVPVSFVFDTVMPGPYEFMVEARHASGSKMSKGGVLLHRREAWFASLPDLEPEDFDAFWERTLAQMRRRPLKPEIREPADRRGVPDAFKLVSFNGLGQTRVHGFLALPPQASADNPVPAKLSLPGAGYGTGPLSTESLSRGWAYLALSIHDLPLAGGESGRHHPKDTWFDVPYQGIGRHDKDEFYYRYAYANSIRAVDFLRSIPQIDPDRIIVSGGSQGGSLAIAVAALEPRIALAEAGIPGRIRWDLLTWKWQANCSFDPPPGVTEQQMFHDCLAYHDIAYMARRVRVPIIFSLSIGDHINPGPLQWVGYRETPDTTDKRLRIAPWSGHGGGPYDAPDPSPAMYQQYIESD